MPPDFVYRSRVWYDRPEMKRLFIVRANERMKMMNCRYFNKGRGACPFGNTCLYLHALNNGEKVDVGPPAPRVARREHASADDPNLVLQLLYWFNADEDDDEDFSYLDFDDDDDDLPDLDHEVANQLLALHFYSSQNDSDQDISMHESFLYAESDSDLDVSFLLT